MNPFIAAFPVLRVAGVGRLWVALAALAIAAEVGRFAALWLTADVAPEWVGFVVTVESSMMLAALLMGSRWTKGRPLGGVLLVACGIELLGTAFLGVSPLLGVFGVLFAVAVIAVGRGQADPTVQAILPVLVTDRSGLAQAGGLIDGTRRAARMLGPALCGFLLLAVPVMGLVPVAASMILGGILLILPLRGIPAEGESSAAPMREVAIWAVCHREVPVVLLCSFIQNWVWVFGPVVGWVVVLEQDLGAPAGAAVYAQLIAAYGLTNIAANLILARRGRVPSATLAFASFSLFGFGIMGVGFGMAASAPLTVLIILAMVAGAGAPAFDLRLALLLQLEAPGGLVSAAFRLRQAAAFIGILSAGAVTSLLVSITGGAALVIIAGAVSVAATGITYVIVKIRSSGQTPGASTI